jgi:AAA family ATP:ADP antiporter
MAVSSGPETIPNLFLAAFIVMLIATPIFGWVASRFPRRVFLPWVYVFFVSNMLIFWVVFSLTLGTEHESIWIGRAFFVWITIFNLFVVSVFWSFMSDIYTREQARRLFGVITAGGSIGALLGGAATSLLVLKIGFHNLFPIAAVMLSMAVICIRQLRRWVAVEHKEEIGETVESEKPLGGNPLSGVTHILASKYFSAIVLASVIASLLGTALYTFTAQLVEAAISGPDERTLFFSNMNVAANALALLGQMFAVKHAVRRFGIGTTLALLPIVSIAGFILLAFNPVLGVVAFLTVIRRALGFSFSKPTTTMLYSVVSPEDKYKTQVFIETTVFRGGDLIGTWAVRLMLGLGISNISIIMLPFAALWAVVSLWLGRDYRRRAKQLKESGVA